jgi:Sedlin, N-terminal conserved region
MTSHLIVFLADFTHAFFSGSICFDSLMNNLFFFRQMFRKLRDAYTNVLWNPFYVPGTKIESKKFDTVVAGIMA